MIRKTAFLVLSVAMGSMLAGTVVAAADTGVTVRYSRAELATASGAERLYARLKIAARQVCPGGEALDPIRAVPARACYDSALAAAVAHVRQPRLTVTASRGA